jgi:TonB-dependent SusC/RagA subfamily outer membrane receptor
MKKIIATILGSCALFTAYSQNVNSYQDTAKIHVNQDTAFRPRSINLNAPLYFVDKKEITGEELNKIDPDDIASIVILKDSASTSMYGRRGRQGVILIEMKDRTKMNIRKADK